MPKTAQTSSILRSTCLLLLLQVAALTGLGCAARAGDVPAAPTIPVSPRLLALAGRVKAGDAGAGALFWSEVERRGTPLVEPLPAGGSDDLVTFLWRGDAGTKGVYLLGSLSGEALLGHLAGTDVWFRSYPVRRDARFTYRLAPFRGSVPKEPGAIRATAAVDPLNPRRLPPSGAPLLSLVEMPAAPAQPWLMRKDGTPRGTVAVGEIRSAILKGGRELTLFTPAGYDPQAAAAYPLLIVFDGAAYHDLIDLPAILDNLIAARRIPPVVAALVGRLDADERDSDLSCNPNFTRFASEEVVPQVRRQLRASTDPRDVVLVGSSLGGLAAFCAGLDRPDLFGNVLSQSGAVWWKPEKEARFEWVRRQVEERPKIALRAYFDAGSMEIRPSGGTGPSLLEANRNLAEALRAKGYASRFAEYAGGHGYANWQATIPDGLIFLLSREASPQP